MLYFLASHVGKLAVKANLRRPLSVSQHGARVGQPVANRQHGHCASEVPAAGGKLGADQAGRGDFAGLEHRDSHIPNPTVAQAGIRKTSRLRGLVVKKELPDILLEPNRIGGAGLMNPRAFCQGLDRLGAVNDGRFPRIIAEADRGVFVAAEPPGHHLLPVSSATQIESVPWVELFDPVLNRGERPVQRSRIAIAAARRDEELHTLRDGAQQRKL